MKKVLIITYYWPPAGGPGVQRVLKFAKYLPQFGWQPLILTLKKGEYPSIDYSLEKNIPNNCLVFKTKSIELNLVYKKFVGLGSDEPVPIAVVSEKNLNWKKKLSNWIRINFFIPDAKILWKYFAVREGKKIIRKYKPDIILSSSPPPTVHIIAKKLSKTFNLPWISDFRDPWTDIYHFDDIKKNKLVEYIESKLENDVLNSCSKIITVSNSLKELFANKIAKKDKTTVIPNGYDSDDFKDIPSPFSKNFTLVYSGKLNAQQNVDKLWKGINKFINETEGTKEKFEILFNGQFDKSIYSSIKENELDNMFKDEGYVDHNKAIENIFRADVLLLIIPDTKKNKGILTGKVFEYLATNKYILAIGPEDGDLAEILNSTKSGKVYSYNTDFSEVFSNLYKKWIDGKPLCTPNISEVKKFSRYEQAKNLSEEMNILSAKGLNEF